MFFHYRLKEGLIKNVLYIRKKELRKKRNRKKERKNQRKIERQSKDKNIYSHPPPFILYYIYSIFNGITKY